MKPCSQRVYASERARSSQPRAASCGELARGIHSAVLTERGLGAALEALATRACRGSGIRGLADRVEALPGNLDLESAPGARTRIRAEIRYRPAGAPAP